MKVIAIPGAVFEVPLEIKVLRRGRIGTGLTFIQKGYQWKTDGKEQYRCNYVQVPLTVGAAIDLGRFSIIPSVGGTMGFNVRGRGTYKSNNSEQDYHFPIDRSGDDGFQIRMPAGEFSLLGGLGFSYRAGRTALRLDLGYQYGLTNAMFDVLFVDQNGVEVPPIEARQRTFSVQLGYQFELGKTRRTSIDTSGSIATERRSRFSIGQRFGATSSAMSFTGSLPEEEVRIVDGAERLTGFATALVANIALGKHFSFQPELAYTQKGWKCQWYPRPTTKNDLLRMNYLELPLLLKYRFGNGKLAPYAIVGPLVGRGMGGFDHYFPVYNPYYVLWSDAQDISFSSKEGDLVPWEFSGIGGAGVNWDLGGSQFFAEVRYQHGFTNVIKDPIYHIYSEKAEVYHRAWMLSVGYLVPWRK